MCREEGARGGIPTLRKEPPTPRMDVEHRNSGKSQELPAGPVFLCQGAKYLAQPTLCATIRPLGVVLGSVTSARPIRNSDDGA